MMYTDVDLDTIQDAISKLTELRESLGAAGLWLPDQIPLTYEDGSGPVAAFALTEDRGVEMYALSDLTER